MCNGPMGPPPAPETQAELSEPLRPALAPDPTLIPAQAPSPELGDGQAATPGMGPPQRLAAPEATATARAGHRGAHAASRATSQASRPISTISTHDSSGLIGGSTT